MIFEVILYVLRAYDGDTREQTATITPVYTVLEALNNSDSDSDYQLQDTDSDSNINAVECASEEHLRTSNESNPCVYCVFYIYL